MSEALHRIKRHGTTVIGCAEAVDKISQQDDATLITEMLNILKLTKVWEECSKDMKDDTDSYFRCATEWLLELPRDESCYKIFDGTATGLLKSNAILTRTGQQMANYFRRVGTLPQALEGGGSTDQVGQVSVVPPRFHDARHSVAKVELTASSRVYSNSCKPNAPI